MSCVFCKIVSGEINAEIVHSDDDCIAFRDLNPQALVHILVIPRKHIDSMNTMKDSESPLLGKMGLVARNLAREEGVDDEGYRLVLNCNAAAGQTVFHVHMHLLGGREFRWPPG